MTHLTDELVNQAIEYVLGKNSGWASNGRCAEGWSINIDKDNFIYREHIERLRLRLNTIEWNLRGNRFLAYWRIRLFQGHFELRYKLVEHERLAEDYPESMLLPMYDDEDGDIVGSRLSFTAFMQAIAKDKIETDDMEIYDFARDFCDQDKSPHYLFNGQLVYEYIHAYLWKTHNSEGMEILGKIVKMYRAYCKEHNLEREKIKTTF